MIRALYTGATGMIAQQTAVDSTANNIANVDTTGYKRGMVEFQDLLYQTVRSPGGETLAGLQVPTGIQIGLGVRVAAIEKIFTQGVLENTAAPLNVAIEGEGFFQLRNPIDGTLHYTRDGTFTLNAQGQIVSANGFFLEPAITIPQDALSITIGQDGTVSVLLPQQVNATQVGQITLARFVNPTGLLAEGQNQFFETPASGPPLVSNPGLNGNGLLRQGFLEGSNVQVVTELINLILAQRAFEFNSRTVRVSDSMLATTAELVRA